MCVHFVNWQFGPKKFGSPPPISIHFPLLFSFPSTQLGISYVCDVMHIIYLAIPLKVKLANPPMIVLLYRPLAVFPLVYMQQKKMSMVL